MRPTTIRSKKISDYIESLQARKEVKQRQAEETREPYSWVLEGEVRAIELIIEELEQLIRKKE